LDVCHTSTHGVALVRIHNARQVLRSPILSALLHGTPVVGVSQTLRRWSGDATYIRQGAKFGWPRCWSAVQ